MSATPSTIALTNIADGANIVAADHRNNYLAVQTGWNQLIDILNDGVAGQVLKGTATTLSWDYPPGYEYGYTEFTSNVSVTATVEASANTVVTAPALAFDGSTSIIVEFFSPELLPDTAAAGRRLQVALFDGSTSLGFLGTVYSQVIGVNHFTPALLRRKLTPAAATKTYSIRALVSAGTGTVGAGAGAAGNDNPGYIRITRA